MPDERIEYNRRSIRIQKFDYGCLGYYFVTICVQHHQCVFGTIIDGHMNLNDTGLLVQSLWERLPRRFSTVCLDTYVIMPNHVHGIVELIDLPLAEKTPLHSRIPQRFRAAMQQAADKKGRPVLGKIVRDFKGAATYEIHKKGVVEFAWLRNYYESVIRDEKSLEEIRNYIINNPETWAKDKLHKS
jgi:putative transposase